MANELILAREHDVFVVAESTKGTLVFPSASDYVIPAGQGKVGQVPTYTDSEEIRNSRSLMDQFADGLPAGDWSIPMYLRPSGSAGSVPQGAAILKALFGQETITASTSVVYALATDLPSFSIWVRYGGVVFFAKGATADQMRLGVSRKGAVKLDLSGKFMHMGWVGTDELASAIDGTVTPVTAIPVTEGKYFSVGGRIQVGTNNNGGAGFEITAVDVATNTLTVSPGVDTAESAGTEVKGYLPTGTEIGSPVEARTFTVSFDGGTTTAKIKGMDISLTNNIQYQEDEITGDDYPTDYVPDRRAVEGTVNLLFRTADLQYFYDGHNGNEVDVQIKCGEDVAGKRATFDLPRVRLKVPDISPEAPTVSLAMGLTALGTSGEDEMSLTLD